MSTITQPYLTGAHTPVSDELDLVELTVTEGAIPPALRGMFVRNSPNPQFTPPGRYHWFDGDGMVHGVRVLDGKAHYVNKWVRTRGFELEREAGRALWGGLLDPVDLENPHGPVKETANTDLVWHAGRLLSLWWLTGEPYELRVPGLETVGPCDFDGTRSAPISAHPKVDPVTGEMMVFGFSVLERPYYGYGVVGADGRVSHWTPIDLPHAHVPHDIAITPTHTILLDMPLGWDKAAMARGKRKIGFDASLPARFGILPRHGTQEDVVWFEDEACYVYHTIGAHREGDVFVLTACRIANPVPDVIPAGAARLDPIALVPHLYRWRFDLATGQVSGEQLDDVPTEFPRVNDDALMSPLRYSYNPRLARTDALQFDGVLKYDLNAGSSIAHSWGEDALGGEVVFVPDPGAEGEDAGWITTVVTHPGEGRSELVVLDARSLEPVCKVALPRAIPVGFHAAWVPGEAF